MYNNIYLSNIDNYQYWRDLTEKLKLTLKRYPMLPINKKLQKLIICALISATAGLAFWQLPADGRVDCPRGGQLLNQIRPAHV